jgi:hypothetical protein
MAKYGDFKFIDDKWCGEWECKSCNKMIKSCADKPYHLKRNLLKKNICKKCSVTGKNNPFYGKKHKNKTLKKISNSRKNKGCGVKNAMNNKVYREKSKLKIKEYWDSKNGLEQRRKQSERLKQYRKEGKIKSVTRSKQEKNIVKEIKKLGLKCNHSFRLESKIYDIFIPKYNLIIEFNGDYWHCNPKKYNEDYFHKVKNCKCKDLWEYDKLKLDLLKNNKYNFEVIWETDYKNNNNIIKEIINKWENKIRP